MGIQPLVTAWAQILIGGRTNGRKEVGGGEGRGRVGAGVYHYFNSSLIRVLAAKHLPCSSPTPIHITPVLLHP